MEIYTEQEAAAKLQRIAQILTDGTIAARKLSQPLDAALRPKVLTEALQPFEAATNTGTAGSVSIYGAAKLQPAFGTPGEYATLKEYGATWRRALIDFAKAWRDLLQAKAVNPQTVEALKQLEYGVEDCIEGVKEWTDENGWPTGESAPRKYFTLLQQFKIQVADILNNQPKASFEVPIIRDETPQQRECRWTAALLIIRDYIANNPKGVKGRDGLRPVLKNLLASPSSELAIALQGCKTQKGKKPFEWGNKESARIEKARSKFRDWMENSGLIWPPAFTKIRKQYEAIASRNFTRNKNKPNKTEGKNA